MSAEHAFLRWIVGAGILAVFLLAPKAGQGATTITFTTTGTTLSSTGTTTVSVFVKASQSGATFEGLNLNLQVADGGYAANGETQDGPLINNVNFSPTGGLFTTATYNAAAFGFSGGNYPTPGTESQGWSVSGSTGSGTHVDTVPTTATLFFTVTIDPSGNYSGSPWTFYLEPETQYPNLGTVPGNTKFTGGTLNASVTYVDNSTPLTATPEPASLGLLGLLVPGLLKRRRRAA